MLFSELLSTDDIVEAAAGVVGVDVTLPVISDGCNGAETTETEEETTDDLSDNLSGLITISFFITVLLLI